MIKKIMLPSSSSLFHFTRKSSVFKKILKNGLRYSESAEYCPNDDVLSDKTYKSNGAYIFPMICFCDIPISRTLAHRKTYGNYAIGFNKDFLCSKLTKTINPVNYISNPQYALFLATLRQRLENEIKDTFYKGYYSEDIKTKIDKEYEIVNALYYYFKPCEFYDEREWRATLSKGIPWRRTMITWEGNYTHDIEKHIESLKNVIKPINVYLTFSSEELSEAISYIILPKEKDVHKYIEHILNEQNPLFGSTNVSQKERILLISKITSFERIEKDY